MTESRSTLDLVICSRDAKEIVSLLKKEPWINIVQATADPSIINTDKVEVLLASPDLAAQLVSKCHQLKWLASTWAGNSPLLKISKQDYLLTATRGIFGQPMREYVFTYALHHARKVEEMKRATNWQAVQPDYLAGKTLGLIGAGSIAQAILPVAQSFDMKVIGINSSGNLKPDYAAMFTLKNKTEFASLADIVVNLLPDTPHSKSVLDKAFFDHMKADSLLINAGRGSAIQEKDLLDGLQQNKPAMAVLDVFNTEPLPQDHPFWSHEKIIITHHTAALGLPEQVVDCFVQNAKRYVQNVPLDHIVSFQKGY